MQIRRARPKFLSNSLRHGSHGVKAMWKRIPHHSSGLAAVAAFLAALQTAALLAQETLPASIAQGNLLQQVKWLRLEVVGGRIVARSDRCSQSRHSAELSASGESRQTLNLESQASTLIVRYEQVDAASQLILDVNERGHLTITHAGLEGSPLPAVSYLQPSSGKITLKIGGSAPRTVLADDLWQLLLVERDLAAAHLLPILATLRPNWRVDEQLDRLETALLERAGADVLAQRRQWQTWVDELTADDFSRRQSADYSLRQIGQPVLAYLRGLEPTQLDGEQRRRIRAILSDLPDGSADCPLRTAAWLAGDKRVWLALMARGDLDQRVAAADHLSKLCRRPLPFDPQGAPEVRQAQLAEVAKLADN
jgi:hypothetical protein